MGLFHADEDLYVVLEALPPNRLSLLQTHNPAFLMSDEALEGLHGFTRAGRRGLCVDIEVQAHRREGFRGS